MTVTKKYSAELYAEQVRSGEILVCEYVCLAVERYYADLDRALDRGRYFDKKVAMRAIHFIEKLKHTQGNGRVSGSGWNRGSSSYCGISSAGKMPTARAASDTLISK